MRKCEHCNYPLEGLPKFLKCPSCGKDLNVDNFETEKVNLPQKSNNDKVEDKKVNKPQKESKVSPHFKTTIKKYLDFRASEDELFAKMYSKKDKNIDDCIKYILNAVKKSGIQGFHDDEIYSMAIHYYTEDKIDIGDDIKCQVIVNHQVVLTEEEKAEARQKAIDAEIRKAKDSLVKKPVKKTIEKVKEVQTDLFG